MKAFLALIKTLLTPLMILNSLGGIVSAVWLLILGEWRLILGGLLVMFAGNFCLTIAFLPSVLLGAPALYLASKEKWTISNVLMLPSILYINAVIAAWCGIVFFFYTLGSTLPNLIPRMIWSYGIATGTLSYLAMKGPSDENAPTGPTIAVLFAEIGYVFAMLRVVMSRGNTFQSFVMTFEGFMLVAALVQWVLGFLVFRRHELEDELLS
jgi:hypothetical protein